MNDLQVTVMTNERLNKLIEETQETLNELKEEVSRRQQVEQEHEIMSLENHMKSAELSLTSIRNFISYLVEGSKQK